MSDFRQTVTDAAVQELPYQLGDQSVDCHGTSVQIDGSFRMAQVISALIRTAVDNRNPAIVEEAAKALAGGDWETATNEASNAITAVRCQIMHMLDPLP